MVAGVIFHLEEEFVDDLLVSSFVGVWFEGALGHFLFL